MSKKSVDDYLTEGIYGTRRPKEAEREQFLGTLRERIVLALTKGQVMSDKGLDALEEAMKKNRDAKLLINGHVAYKFLKEEKALANKYNISSTTVTDNENDTDIGAVLTYDHAIDKEEIFMEMEEKTETATEQPTKSNSLFSKLKKWLS